MQSTRKIRQQLQPSSIRAAITSGQSIQERREVYENRIWKDYEEGVNVPSDIFIHLLNDYLAMEAATPEKTNVLLAQRMVNFSRNITLNNAENADYLFSVIAMLNERYDNLEEDDDLLPILSAFFSVYGLYRSHLHSAAQKKLESTDIWKADFDEEMKTVLWRENRYMRLRGLSEHRSLETFSSDVATRLSGDMTHTNEKIRREAVKFLLDFNERIPHDLQESIVKKMMMVIRDSSEIQYAPCVLLRVYFPLVPVEDRAEVINYLLSQLSKPDLGMHALRTLSSLTEYVSEEGQRAIIDALFEAKKDWHSSSVPTEIIIRLHHLVSDAPRFYIEEKLRSDDDVNDMVTHYVENHCFKWLKPQQQTELMAALQSDLSGENVESKEKALGQLACIGDQWTPQEHQLSLFYHLFMTLKERDELEEDALETLNQLCPVIPLNKQALFVDYLIERLATLPRFEYRVRELLIEVLGQLNLAIPEDKRLQLIHDLMVLKSEISDSCFAGAVFNAIGRLSEAIPDELYQTIVDQLLDEIRYEPGTYCSAGGASTEAAAALAKLAKNMPNEMRNKVGHALFNIAMDNTVVINGKQCAIEAFTSYVDSLSHHEKTALLGRLVSHHHEGLLEESEKLYAHLCNSYQKDITHALLQRAQEEFHTHIPKELREEIVRLGC